jgi:hypothetical protein
MTHSSSVQPLDSLDDLSGVEPRSISPESSPSRQLSRQISTGMEATRDKQNRRSSPNKQHQHRSSALKRSTKEARGERRAYSMIKKRLSLS